MTEVTFAAEPGRLLLAASAGIICLLILIIKFKLHPVISMMISAVIIGAGAGMPLSVISETVEKGVGKTLQGIALLVGLGSMFGGILEVSGGAQKVAQTLIDKFGQKKAGWALGLTGLVIGTTVFFEAGVVVLIPLVFSVAKQTERSTLFYAIPLLSGLASGYAFVPPVSRLRSCCKFSECKFWNHDDGGNPYGNSSHDSIRNYLGKIYRNKNIYKTAGKCTGNKR